jgi:uncharacterized OB-fold protein
MMSSLRSKSPPAAFLDVVFDVWTEPFWRAAGEHRLTAACCANCSRFRMPPTPFCPHCRSQSLTWPELSGEGEIYSYTIVSRAIFPEMEGALPYVPAVIALPDADGVRLISNVIGADLDRIAVGLRVRVAWNDRPGGIAIPQFELVD